MHLLTIRLFGEYSAADHRGNALSVGNRRTHALVNYLALQIENGGSAEEVATLLGDRVANLIADLRYALRFLPNEILIVDGDSIRFNPAVVWVDAQKFETLAARGSIHDVRQATELYRGNLLEGYVSGFPAFEEWLGDRRIHYWRTALGLFGKLLAAQIRAGWWESAAETANRLLELDPSQEVVHRALMRLQIEQGRPDSALRRYHECADILRREFGRPPSQETERVHDEIVAALERTPAPREMQVVSADRPILVLLVEDDMVSSALVEGFLAEAGYEVVAVADSADALIEIGRRRFDLLILDINLPTLSGLRLFELMIQKGYDTPAIFITGMSDPAAETRSLEMGASDFIRKPIRKEPFLRRVRTIVQHLQRRHTSP
jgi:DNA-binding SARP family transcriptional activator